MNNTFFSKFTPKEPKFFPILKEMSDVLLTASNLMISCLEKGDHESATDFYFKIKEQERKGDELSNRIFNELNTTFITPFDREDIHMLANRLDDVTDYLCSGAKKIMLYDPEETPESAVMLAKCILEGAQTIGMAVDELDVLKKDPKRIAQYCRDLHDIENKADDVYDHFINDLFKSGRRTIEIVKLKEIMSELEKAVDATEHVGKIIQTIIVKYA
jgi:predicted phosphate transport protein (TIGR00153 family)